MKVAVQIYGHLRTFERCAPLLKTSILDHYDCDVFIHTWNQTDHQTKTWWRSESDERPGRCVDQEVLILLEKLYSPKSVKVEAQGFFDQEGEFGTLKESARTISLKGLKYMSYSLFQVNCLREEYALQNDIDYDYVVVTRPDIMILEKLDIEKFREEFEYFRYVSIHFCLGLTANFYQDKLVNANLGGDCLYFSVPEVIGRIARMYEEFNHFFIHINSILPDRVGSPEIAFFESIHQKGIISRKYSGNFVIVREHSVVDYGRPQFPLEITAKSIGGKDEKGVVATLNRIYRKSSAHFRIRLARILVFLGRCGNYLVFLDKNRMQ